MAINQIGSVSQSVVTQVDPAMRQAPANVVPPSVDQPGAVVVSAVSQPSASKPITMNLPAPAASPATLSEKKWRATTKQHGDDSADPSKLRDAIKSANQFLQMMSRDLSFSIDKSTGKTIVKITDNTTKKVIRQIPSAEILAISKALEALDKLQGLLIKEHA